MLKKDCYSISTLEQFKKLIHLKKNKKKILIVFIKNNLITNFGIDWLRSLVDLIKTNYSDFKVKFYVDCADDYGLSILIIKEKIDYIKLNSNKIILKKINQIAKKNKVLLNPDFNIISQIDINKIGNL